MQTMHADRDEIGNLHRSAAAYKREPARLQVYPPGSSELLFAGLAGMGFGGALDPGNRGHPSWSGLPSSFPVFLPGSVVGQISASGAIALRA
ncbi:MAG: hypothetical protein KBC66_05070 [Kiritimatiellae bacterium]|nr:hypothetical protein [Kiritimatiellia bacterium]NLD90538.1 hypothetical protein [Lentisphaerota bacterium]HQN79955.1 hypothetical protein [Kiritimatiellia bacterium]